MSTTTTVPNKPKVPTTDGEVNLYESTEDAGSSYFDRGRRAVFVNGMGNSGDDHAASAVALSLLQMCPVIGVYNRSSGFFGDVGQCLLDKNQFNGFSSSARRATGRAAKRGTAAPEAARALLARNPAAVSLFDLLRLPENRRWEVFAHSQGNLILSNALQAIEAVDGPGALTGRVVHMFGSPAVTWPPEIVKREYGFTWDPVTWLAGFDASFSISKVGMPKSSPNPVTHAFIEYMKCDPAFLVNRYRWGGLGVTFKMDEDGLADGLVAIGTNLPRVAAIFRHLDRHHNSDADDVAVRYVQKVAGNPALLRAVKANRELNDVLTRVMKEGWTSSGEAAAIALLKSP